MPHVEFSLYFTNDPFRSLHFLPPPFPPPFFSIRQLKLLAIPPSGEERKGKGLSLFLNYSGLGGFWLQCSSVRVAGFHDHLRLYHRLDDTLKSFFLHLSPIICRPIDSFEGSAGQTDIPVFGCIRTQDALQVGSARGRN